MEPLVREALARLLAIFRQCEVAVTGEVNETLIQELARVASRSGPSAVARTVEQIVLPGLISALLPGRWLSYDTERIYDPEDYALLTAAFAAVTGGEWQPQNVRSELEPEEWTAELREARVEFDIRHQHAMQHVLWRFAQDDDWVSEDFTRALRRFATNYLPGDFVHLDPGDQGDAYAYLPRLAALHVVALKNELTERLEPRREATSHPLGSISLEGWHIFDEVGGLVRLRKWAERFGWVMDPGEPAIEPFVSMAVREREGWVAAPINWEELAAQARAGPTASSFVASSGAVSPSRVDLYSSEQVTLAVRTLTNLYLTLEHAATTVFVPFAPSPAGVGGFTIAPSEPEVYLSGDPAAWYVAPTWAVFLEWQRLPEVERQYAEQAFARRLDPRVDVVDEGWFRGAFVFFARQAVQHGLPVLLRFSREPASAERA